MVKRKAYGKPQINQVKLVPEDAVLAGCKLSGVATGSSNKNAGRCNTATQACQNAGS